MARKRGNVACQAGRINAIEPYIWDRYRGAEPEPGEERDDELNPRYRRTTARENKLLAVINGVDDHSSRIACSSLTVREAAMILGVRYEESTGSWTTSPLGPDYVRKLAKEGKIKKIGHNKYDKQSVSDWAVLAALSKRRLTGEYLHTLHPLTTAVTIPVMNSV